MTKRQIVNIIPVGTELGQSSIDRKDIGEDFPWIVAKVWEDLFLQSEYGALPHDYVAEDGLKLTLLAKELAGMAVLSSLDEFLAELKPARKHRSLHGLPTNE